MSDQVSAAFSQQYTTNIMLLLQQMGSVLEMHVSKGSYQGKAAKVVEQIGSVVAQKKVTRHSKMEITNTPHDARWVHPVDYGARDLIDNEDKLRMLINPQSMYAKNQALAIGRAKDNEIISAFFADAKTGEDGTTTTSFDTANQQIAAASSGLTVSKLRTAKEILLSNNVDTRFDKLKIAYTGNQLTDLLKDPEVTNGGEFNKVKPLVDGEVNYYMGFEFIHTELLTVDGSGDRRLPCWAESGMHYGEWQGVMGFIDRLPESWHAHQVATYSTFGATRLEEGKVVEILCAES